MVRRRGLQVLVWLAFGLAATPAAPAQTSPPGTRLTLAGLERPVEVLRDRFGVNHIYAETEADLFFAQGFCAARDRMFQLEMWRRQATGSVADFLGRRELKRDIGARLLRFRGDLDQELAFYHPRGKAIVGAFVRGVNAWIAETERDPALVPLELRLLGIRPGRFTPEVVISRHQALLDNLPQEIALAQAIRAVGEAKLRETAYFQGGDPVLTPDPALDLSLIDRKTIELYEAYRAPLRFRPEDVTPAERAAPQAREAEPGRETAASLWPSLDIGSNNWAVSGRLTQSGYPILANDPHRAIGAPSLRYFVHLVGPGWNVIGAGEPALPGVSIGHNESGAWGLTIFGNDSEDLYVYDTNPASPNQYRYRGGFEEMRVERETLAIEGERPETVELRFTRHGPVLFEDRTRHTAYALRGAWLDLGGAPYLASLRMDQARSWEEFREACGSARIPSENMVWADRRGTIGWQATGVQPLRRGWSGLLPVPGDGRYEWDGYLPVGALPGEASPARGFVATANNFLFPIDYPWKDALHFTWADPYRASRIAELLGSGRLFSTAEMARVQNDELSIPARALVPLLRDLAIDDPAVAKARDALLSWDLVLDRDSSSAGLYAMWQRHLLDEARNALVPLAARPHVQLAMKRVIDALTAPDGRLEASPLAARDTLLTKSLADAVSELQKRFGPDRAAWRYGQEKFKHALIRHPLSEAVREELRAKLDVGPLPRGGDAYTVNATGNGDNQTSGGSAKIIIDTEDWDTTLGQNTPGQSGDPNDTHYRDLFEPWARGRYFPLLYSRARVETITESRMHLDPSPRPRQPSGVP